MTRKNILTDHKKVGKKLVPPMAQVPLILHSHYHDTIPQLIHLALYRATNSLQSTVDFSRELAIAANVGDGMAVHSLIANLTDLSELRTNEVKSVISRNVEFADLMRSFYRLYPDFPLRFLLGDGIGTWLEQEILKKLRATIINFSDSRSRFSTEVLGCFYYGGLCAGTVRLTSEVEVPNFEAIRDYPDTDESRRVASQIRASCNGLIGHMAENSLWTTAFWNRGFKFSDCK